MSESLIVTIVRHGKSQSNERQNLALEIPNWLIKLLDVGKQQAQQAGEIIQRNFPDLNWLIFSSPYIRAEDTAQILKSTLGKKVFGITTTDSIREFYSGSEATNDKTSNKHISKVYGEPEDDSLKQNSPFYFNSLFSQGLDKSPADGESGLDVLARTKTMTEALIKFAKNRDISELAPIRTNNHCSITDIETKNLGIVLTSHSLAISALLENFGVSHFQSFSKRYKARNASPIFLEINSNGNARLMDELNKETISAQGKS